MVIVNSGRLAIGFFANADEIFGGDESACETEDHIKRDEPPKLQPGKCGAVDSHPHGLTDEHVGIGGRVGWEALMQIKDDGKRGAGKCHEKQDEKSPARPDEGQGECEKQIQATPSDNGKGEGGETERFEL